MMPGPVKVDCPCGCDKFGTPRGRVGHVRGCTCPRCQGARNRRKGLAAQRVARRQLGVPDAKVRAALSDEEAWRGPFRVEVKSGAQVRPLATRFLAAEAQAEASHATGDPRPFMFVAMPEHMGHDGIVALRLSTWRDHVVPLLEEAGW